MLISRVKESNNALLEAFERLLPQLSQSAKMPTEEYLASLLENENIHLLVAEDEGEVVGMLTLAVVDIPTGRKCWIEDVVVDGACRGRGIGEQLVEHSLALASQLGAKKVYLTSNPSRTAAHHLYRKCGFEEYDTTLFRINFATK